MKCKLIASDLDGTLLDSKGKLSSENSKAITELANMGVIFVPTTGRAFYEMPECIRNHPDIRYFISSNGAVIYDKKTGDKIQTLMDIDTVSELHSKMKKSDLWIIHHKNDYAFTEAKLLNKRILDDYKIPEKFQKQLFECTKVVDDLDNNLLDGNPFAMICGCFAVPEQREAFIKEIQNVSNIHCTASSSFIVEIVKENAGKHNAIAALIQKLGFTTDEIITIGDSTNDLEMIKMTKNSVAVSNGMDIIKENAGHIGPTNDENILKFILNEYI